ncbi:MAG: sodium/proline symporter [Bradymonadia bacterium]
MGTIAASFIACLLVFTLIGVMSSKAKQTTTEDYLVASRNIPPWLVALSAVSTNNSGYMFVGLIGFTYAYGLSSIWLSLGWLVGDFLAWFVVHKPLRESSGTANVSSIPGFLAHDRQQGNSRLIAVIAGLMTLAFLSVYAAAQLKAGSKALHVMFGWEESLGAIIGAVLVVVYCFSGGIRASIWTDAAQSMVMIGAMLMLVVVVAMEFGGPDELLAQLEAIDPQLVTLTPPDAEWGLAVYILGWLAAGIAVVGQPHIMIRTMTLDDPAKMGRTRNIYFAWYLPFTILAILAGLYSRVFFEDGGITSSFDAELALPTMAMGLLPEVLVGLILAALFAATMSTADSQLLSCSAAITQDVAPTLNRSYFASKMATIGVTLLALAVALFGSGNVFTLVVLAWSSLGAGLGPLMFVRAKGRSVSPALGGTMIVAGVATVLVWKYVLEWGGGLYEVLPGMLAGFLIYAVGSAMSPQPVKTASSRA